jgi:lantibiotic modifying enzyme
MSHGAAGYAYALASLALAAQREEFANSASECIAFENSSHDPSRNNWPHFRGEGEPTWPCQWCHGAAGIGLARIAMVRQRGINAILDTHLLRRDIKNALKGVELGSESPVDTMCCGTLGCIEFLREAGGILGRSDLRDLAARRLLVIQQTAASTGDYRWNAGKKQFNLGLFRGLAGVGYTFLRQVDSLLPNILIWE